MVYFTTGIDLLDLEPKLRLRPEAKAKAKATLAAALVERENATTTAGLHVHCRRAACGINAGRAAGPLAARARIARDCYERKPPQTAPTYVPPVAPMAVGCAL